MVPIRLSSKLGGCLVISMATVFFVGARKITELRIKDSAEDKAREQITYWHTQISLELPSELMSDWVQMGQQAPFTLLKACAVEERIKDGEFED